MLVLGMMDNPCAWVKRRWAVGEWLPRVEPCLWMLPASLFLLFRLCSQASWLPPMFVGDVSAAPPGCPHRCRATGSAPAMDLRIGLLTWRRPPNEVISSYRSRTANQIAKDSNLSIVRRYWVALLAWNPIADQLPNQPKQYAA